MIGSAALALHDVAVEPADVDLLVSEADFGRLAGVLGLPLRSGPPHPDFRLHLFGRWSAGLLPVEVMAGFALRSGAVWDEIRPQTRIRRLIGMTPIFVPDIPELRHLLARFGRAKDRARLALLDDGVSRPAAPVPRTPPPPATPPR